jgi:NADH-quinone oxidoreductase subunit L
MFLACGVGAFGIAMFHVTTHAFFKALLFLGSGSVIHAMGGEQDMRKMGGLGPRIPTTFRTMLIGTLAIAGIVPFAGFWSKDEILLNAFAGPEAGGLGHWSLWLGGFVVAGMTAFYMVRMMMKTFAGAPRFSDAVGRHVHESPVSMTLPLVVLAFLSAVGGFLNAPLIGIHALDDFLGTTTNWREASGAPFEVAHNTELALLVASIILAIVMCLVARALYLRAPRGERLPETKKVPGTAWHLLYHRYFVDEIYNTLFVRRGKRLSRWLWQFFDVRIIDGIVNGVAGLVGLLGGLFRNTQTGYVRNYALTMLLGAVIVVIGCLVGLGNITGR